MLVATLILTLCLTSLVVVLLAKLYHYYQSPHHSPLSSHHTGTDLDNLSSLGSLGQEFMQLDPATEVQEGQYGTVSRSTPRPPRGILKQSRTQESLTLYSNPALEEHSSPEIRPVRLQEPGCEDGLQRLEMVGKLGLERLRPELSARAATLHRLGPRSTGPPPGASGRAMTLGRRVGHLRLTEPPGGLGCEGAGGPTR